MRTAKINDHWRRTYSRDYSTNISTIEFRNVPGLGSGTLHLNGGVTAICGINGAGKTTLLATLLGITNPKYIQSSNTHLLKLKESTISGQLNISNQQVNRSLTINSDSKISFEPELIDINTVWIDISLFCNEMIMLFQDMQNLTELLEQHEERLSDKEEVDLLSYVIGKTYSSVVTTEIELADDKIVPYFIVECDGISYGSELMGAGEISVFYILWQLQRLPKNSVLLIEEPETFLSPHAQAALLNVIAKYSEEQQIWSIITTHSPNILTKIPPQHVRLLSRLRNQVRIITPQDQSYLSVLGIPPRKIGVLFVEDRAAREFTKVWISRFAPHLISQIEIKDMESESKIKAILVGFPLFEGWLKIIGVFDGDQSERLNETYTWPYIFLPGTKSPEEELRDAVYKDPYSFANASSRELETVHMKLSEVDGLNHHDWLIELHRSLGMTYEQMIFALFETWFICDNNSDLARDAFDKLLEKISFS